MAFCAAFLDSPAFLLLSRLFLFVFENGVQRRQAYSRFAGRSLSEKQQPALDTAVSDNETEEKKPLLLLQLSLSQKNRW